MVPAGEDGISRRGADTRGGMAIGKTHSLIGKAINGRCCDLASFRVVALDITIAEIVSVDDHDVRCARRFGSNCDGVKDRYYAQQDTLYLQHDSGGFQRDVE